MHDHPVKPASAGGRLLYGGSYIATAMLLGTPLATSDQDPFAAITVP